MSRDIWNPRQYRTYASERARPFFELLARVDVESPSYVVDLGCGPGERTADLAARWPDAIVEGIDSSAQMIAEARRTVLSHAARAATRDQANGVRASGGEDGAGLLGGDTRFGGADPAPGGEDGAGDAADTDNVHGAQEANSEIGRGAGELRFSVGDLAEWKPERPVGVIFSNAALQWVPGHRRLLRPWVEALAPGGRLALSMPGNFNGPSHVALRELAGSPRWRNRLGHTIRQDVIVSAPADYLELLGGLGCDVDAWETTYLQVLPGEDPVLEWMKGTALRPVIDALPDGGEREEFLAGLAARLRQEYPPGPYGTVFPFRRIFVVAGKRT